MPRRENVERIGFCALPVHHCVVLASGTPAEACGRDGSAVGATGRQRRTAAAANSGIHRLGVRGIPRKRSNAPPVVDVDSYIRWRSEQAVFASKENEMSLKTERVVVEPDRRERKGSGERKWPRQWVIGEFWVLQPARRRRALRLIKISRRAKTFRSIRAISPLPLIYTPTHPPARRLSVDAQRHVHQRQANQVWESPPAVPTLQPEREFEARSGPLVQSWDESGCTFTAQKAAADRQVLLAKQTRTQARREGEGREVRYSRERKIPPRKSTKPKKRENGGVPEAEDSWQAIGNDMQGTHVHPPSSSSLCAPRERTRSGNRARVAERRASKPSQLILDPVYQIEPERNGCGEAEGSVTLRCYGYGRGKCVPMAQMFPTSSSQRFRTVALARSRAAPRLCFLSGARHAEACGRRVGACGIGSSASEPEHSRRRDATLALYLSNSGSSAFRWALARGSIAWSLVEALAGQWLVDECGGVLRAPRPQRVLSPCIVMVRGQAQHICAVNVWTTTELVTASTGWGEMTRSGLKA
ncbi:hypothetical protein C8R45DRAFT_921714 [Mycena sanguinolenta]|nr:hypothetical protein C8R45DRAFT_921714 [Mycena sanguinolenta]